MGVKMSAQDIIAALMEGEPADGAPLRSPTDKPTSGTQVTDGLSNMPITQLKECDAQSCSNWVDGRCSLTAVSINQTGGCANYAAKSEDYDRNDVYDSKNISSISDAMPDSIDRPSGFQNMTGRFNPGSMT